MNRSTTYFALLALLTACGDKEEARPDNCLTSEACCDLAQEEGEGDCLGEDLNENGWGDTDDLADLGLQVEDGDLLLLPNTATRVPVVWITSTNENKVARYDSETGEELLRVSTFGYFPNRTAVAADGSVWITNRDSYQFVHIGGDGAILCSSPQGSGIGPGYTRAAAIDNRGYAWIGLHDIGQALKVDPVTPVEGDEDYELVTISDFSPDLLPAIDVPKCRVVATVDLVDEVGTRVYPYGLAADGEGKVWAGVLSGGPVAAIDADVDDDDTDPSDAAVIGVYDPLTSPLVVAAGGCWSPYGMTLDLEGNPWYMNLGCGNVVKLDKDTGEVVGVYSDPAVPNTMQGPRAGGIDRNGHIWVAENYATSVVEFEPDGTFAQRVDFAALQTASPIPGCALAAGAGTLGTGSDIDGNMWTVMQNIGQVVKYTTDGEILGCYPDSVATEPPLLASPYTYSDLTGSTYGLVTSSLGRVRFSMDGGAPVHWRRIAYRATVPEATSVCVRARTATSEGGLADAEWTAEYCENVAAPAFTIFRLEDGAGAAVANIADSQFLEVELQLSSSDPEVSPRVSLLSVAARPL
jgi:streptogramin lyase